MTSPAITSPVSDSLGSEAARLPAIQSEARENSPMTSATFDFAPLLPPDLPTPAVKWTGLPRYNFTGGNNDADQVPVDELIAAATSVLRREGSTLATYGLASGPQGYRALREFLVAKLKRDA